MYFSKLDNNFTWFCIVFILINLCIVPRFTQIWPRARYWWNCSLEMAPWTLLLHWRFIIYHLHVLWKAGQQLYMVLHSIHPQKPIHYTKIYSYFTARARYRWNCSLEMAPWTLLLHWRLKIYHLHILWKAGQQLYMVLHSIHPQKPIHCAKIYSYFTAPRHISVEL
jgi:hypothetical protein